MTPDFILRTASWLYSVRTEDITSRDVRRHVSWSRMAAMAISLAKSRATSTVIGSTFHRDHASVWQAKRRVQELNRQAPDFAALYTLFEKILEADMRIYISGPLTDKNKDAFRTTAELIDQTNNWCAVNPRTVTLAVRWRRGFNDLSPAHQHAALRRAALRNLMGCEAIVQLPGSKSDPDAGLEYLIAKDCDMQIFPSLKDFLATQPMQKVLA